MRRTFLSLICLVLSLSACGPSQPHITVGSKFFTEQVILAELLAQHIEARTGIHVERTLGNVALSARSTVFQTRVDKDLIFSETAGRNVLGGATTRTAGPCRITSITSSVGSV